MKNSGGTPAHRNTGTRNSEFGSPRKSERVGLTTKRHATKACAYSPSPEDRARIPADVKQHYFESTDSATGLTSRHYGIEIGGAADRKSVV